MGHIVGKEIFQKLGDKLDELPFRVNKSKSLYNILKSLYSADEAELIVSMPHGLSVVSQLEKLTRFERGKLISLLDSMSSKGLIVDLFVDGTYYYMPSPMVIGIFEFTMMRTGDNLKSREWAELFHNYLSDPDSYGVNFGNGQKISPIRALPHEGTVLDEDFTEILDYEKVTEIIESQNKFAIGICSCRHEKLHLNLKRCDAPLDSCSTFGDSVDYMVRHNFARSVSKEEMHENVSRSKEMGLVFSCDNVRKNVSFLCQCCGDCCNLLLGISKFGYPNMVVTSGFIACVENNTCIGCGKCAVACPIGAINMIPSTVHEVRVRKLPVIDENICIGCGVCSLKCTVTNSLKLVKRKKRVIHPESTFERVILQCLERDTLQHQIFGNPDKVTHKIMKGIVGGFLRLPSIKRALMSDTLRSSFLGAMKYGAARQNKDFLIDR